MNSSDLFSYLASAERRILDFLGTSDANEFFGPEDIRDSVWSYVRRPAKRLRPAVLMMACGSVGGEEREAIAVPAAAGIELFHTWTLVHDDLIDNDRLRRGQATVHQAMSVRARERYGLPDGLADDYGRDVAVLTGDMQQGWCVTCFIDCALRSAVDPVLMLKIIRHLQTYVMGNLICGEMLDVQYGMRGAEGMADLDEDKIVRMLWLKTGVLYEFAGLAGALIGKNTGNFEDEQVRAIQAFTSNCGTAFQLQDDILGLVGDQGTLGKPVGSDIREGKMTVIVHQALTMANPSQKDRLQATLGNGEASPDDVEDVIGLLRDLGGIEHTEALAKHYIHKALPYLDVIAPSRYKDLLLLWADFMVNREF